jgi:hypothetical protein
MNEQIGLDLAKGYSNSKLMCRGMNGGGYSGEEDAGQRA